MAICIGPVSTLGLETCVLSWTVVNLETLVGTRTAFGFGTMASSSILSITERQEGSLGDILALISPLQQAGLIDSPLVSSSLSGSRDSTHQYALDCAFPTSKGGQLGVRSRSQPQRRRGLQSSSQEGLLSLNQLLANVAFHNEQGSVRSETSQSAPGTSAGRWAKENSPYARQTMVAAPDPSIPRGHLVFTLFDSGSDVEFISKHFVEKAGLMYLVSPLASPRLIAGLGGGSIVSKEEITLNWTFSNKSPRLPIRCYLVERGLDCFDLLLGRELMFEYKILILQTPTEPKHYVDEPLSVAMADLSCAEREEQRRHERDERADMEDGFRRNRRANQRRNRNGMHLMPYQNEMAMSSAPSLSSETFSLAPTLFPGDRGIQESESNAFSSEQVKKVQGVLQKLSPKDQHIMREFFPSITIPLAIESPPKSIGHLNAETLDKDEGERPIEHLQESSNEYLGQNEKQKPLSEPKGENMVVNMANPEQLNGGLNIDVPRNANESMIPALVLPGGQRQETMNTPNGLPDETLNTKYALSPRASTFDGSTVFGSPTVAKDSVSAVKDFEEKGRSAARHHRRWKTVFVKLRV
ncbi:hypothetical protein NA57DRAFT_61910 [Rhizodiscina lignyota]|uniref:Uncharacterized protein n=1 Tax=Rhizodiscina lignyota TaxID=1504668 RepID=A0A9P4M4Q4_9PEZI|nr:hypothetical protein NA57DRAFT_61910 [Rhizodiscina lignyota]